MATFTYTKPTVGGSEDTWGDTLNANWDAVAAFIGPLDSTELAVLDGITASTAELNLLDGVTWTLTDYNTLTATAAELNLLDGATATTDEINYLSGVTSAIQDQIDAKAPDNELTQVEVEDDTSTVFGQVSGQRLAQAVAAFAVSAEDLTGADGYVTLSNGLTLQWTFATTPSGATTVNYPISFSSRVFFVTAQLVRNTQNYQSSTVATNYGTSLSSVTVYSDAGADLLILAIGS